MLQNSIKITHKEIPSTSYQTSNPIEQKTTTLSLSKPYNELLNYILEKSKDCSDPNKTVSIRDIDLRDEKIWDLLNCVSICLRSILSPLINKPYSKLWSPWENPVLINNNLFDQAQKLLENLSKTDQLILNDCLNKNTLGIRSFVLPEHIEQNPGILSLKNLLFHQQLKKTETIENEKKAIPVEESKNDTNQLKTEEKKPKNESSTIEVTEKKQAETIPLIEEGKNLFVKTTPQAEIKPDLNIEYLIKSLEAEDLKKNQCEIIQKIDRHIEENIEKKELAKIIKASVAQNILEDESFANKKLDDTIKKLLQSLEQKRKVHDSSKLKIQSYALNCLFSHLQLAKQKDKAAQTKSPQINTNPTDASTQNDNLLQIDETIAFHNSVRFAISDYLKPFECPTLQKGSELERQNKMLKVLKQMSASQICNFIAAYEKRCYQKDYSEHCAKEYKRSASYESVLIRAIELIFVIPDLPNILKRPTIMIDYFKDLIIMNPETKKMEKISADDCVRSVLCMDNFINKIASSYFGGLHCKENLSEAYAIQMANLIRLNNGWANLNRYKEILLKIPFIGDRIHQPYIQMLDALGNEILKADTNLVQSHYLPIIEQHFTQHFSFFNDLLAHIVQFPVMVQTEIRSCLINTAIIFGVREYGFKKDALNNLKSNVQVARTNQLGMRTSPANAIIFTIFEHLVNKIDQIKTNG